MAGPKNEPKYQECTWGVTLVVESVTSLENLWHSRRRMGWCECRQSCFPVGTREGMSQEIRTGLYGRQNQSKHWADVIYRQPIVK